MIAVLILSHGGLARELLGAAETISGRTPRSMRALCLDWEAGFDEAREATADALEKLQPNTGVLILTDMYGGTPFNVARSFAESPTVKVLAGVNLPMVVRLCCLGATKMPVGELVTWLEEKGRRSICHCLDNHLPPDGDASCDEDWEAE